MGTPLYLITGAAGFVGSELVRNLRAQGLSVRAMVRASRGINERQREVLRELENLGAQIQEGDVCDPASLRRAMQGVEGVHHIAAVYRETNIPDRRFFEVNSEGTRNVFEAAIASGVSRVVHCSTGGVLGDIKNPPGNDGSPYAPEDVYQESKVEAEKIALDYFRSGRMSGVVIRPAMIYGPRDTRFLKLFRAIARRRFVHIGNGRQWVHYVDVRDLAHGFALGMSVRERSGEIYSIAGERPVHFSEFVNLIAAELDVPPPRWHVPLLPLQWLGSACEIACRPFGISPPLYRRRVDFFAKNRYFDTSKAERELGYKPARDLKAEVREVVAWYRGAGWL